MKKGTRRSVRGSILLFALLCETLTSAAGAGETGYFKLSTGAEYTSGDYGGSDSIEEWYVPVTGKYLTDRLVLRLTIPYLQVSAPGGSVISGGPDSPVIRAGSGSRSTESGLGDIIAGLTYRDLLNTEQRTGVALDVTGKVKFGTADEDKGLGTGENDYTLQADLVKYFERFSPYGSLGYVVRGDPPGYELDNTAFAVVGGSYRFSPVLSASVDGYFRESSTATGDDQKELTTALNYRVNNRQKVQAYVIRGFDDGSPDWGVGLMLSFSQ